MSNEPVNLPWGTYILVVYDCKGNVVERETYTGQSGTSMMDCSVMARHHWDRTNPEGAPHKTDW